MQQRQRRQQHTSIVYNSLIALKKVFIFIFQWREKRKSIHKRMLLVLLCCAAVTAVVVDVAVAIDSLSIVFIISALT